MSRLDPRGKAGRNRGRSFCRDAAQGGRGRGWFVIHGEERIWCQTGWAGMVAGLGAWVGDAGGGGAGPALPTEARNLEERTGSQIERAGACL